MQICGCFSTIENNNIVFYSKDSTYYQGKIIMQQIERFLCKKYLADDFKLYFFTMKKKKI
jgi:hypothetical protein